MWTVKGLALLGVLLLADAARADGGAGDGRSSQCAQELEQVVRLRTSESSLLHRRLPSRALARFNPRTGAVSEGAIRLGDPLTLIHIWATHCQPCVEEMPTLLRLFEGMQADRPLRILLVAEDELSRLIPYAAAHLRSHSGVELATLSPESGWREHLGERGLPLTLLIDRDRVVRQAFVGSLKERRNELISALEQLSRLR